MLQKLKKIFTEVTSPRIYAFLASMYWIFHPLRISVVLVPWGGKKYLVKILGCPKFLVPMTDVNLVQEIWRVDPYERVFKIKKGDIVLDVGAHVGVFTMKAAREVGENGFVVAIEPEPQNLTLLEKNIEINGLNNVKVVDKAVGRCKKRAKLYLNHSSEGHSLMIKRSDRYICIEVEVDTLDNLVSELGLERINFIKMDIEGAELEALKGAEKILHMSGIKLAIAAYHILHRTRSFYPIYTYLKSKGLTVHTKSGYFIHAQLAFSSHVDKVA